MSHALRVQSVSVRPHGDYEHAILSDVSLSVDSGRITSLIGPSGSGKTTALLVTAGLIAPDKGTIALNSLEADGTTNPNTIASLRIAVLLQEPESMFFSNTVAREIGFGLDSNAVPADEKEERIKARLRQVGLSDEYLTRSPLELSGGEQRLVALASVLVLNPDILVLDEPTAGLAPSFASRIANLIQAEANEGCGILLASHDAELVSTLSDNIIVLSNGELLTTGSVAEVFTNVPELVKHRVPIPVSARLAHAWRVDFTNDYKELSHNIAAAIAAGREITEQDREKVAADASDARSAPQPYSLRRPGYRSPGIASILLGGGFAGLTFLLPLPITSHLILALALFATSRYFRMHSRRLFVLLCPVALLGLMAAAMHSITTPGTNVFEAGPVSVTVEGLQSAIQAFLRVTGPVLAGLAFMGNRTAVELGSELSRLLRRIPWGRKFSNDASMAVLLTVRLLPVMRKEILRIDRSQLARGVSRRRGNLKTRVHGSLALAIPILLSAIHRSERLAIALYMRGFGSDQAPLGGSSSIWSKHDLLWAVGFPGVFVAATSFVIFR